MNRFYIIDRVVDIIVLVLFFLLLVGIVVGVTMIVVERQERHECAKWAVQDAEFPEFHYTDWQKEQCNIK